ncbi:MAG: hypothetical protein ACXW1M_02130, partial [Acidimicrobiia bacterium]
MQLWTEELEAMRAETRAAVDSTLPAILELMGRTDDAEQDAAAPPRIDRHEQDRDEQDRDEQVARARKAIEAIYFPSPEADEREIAGVPCRVFRPDGPASAVYLHFHGGGMMIGAPEMSDLASVDLRDRFGL